MAMILYVTNDPALQRLALQNLAKAGYEVVVVGGGYEALRSLQQMAVAVLVFDTEVDDMSAEELCARLEGDVVWEGIPIVFLAPPQAKWLPGTIPLRGERDALITKPFTSAEVQREVERLLAGRPSSGTVVLAEGVEVDRGAQEVRGQQGTVLLTPTEFHLLMYLAERSGNIVSSAELLEKVWEFYPGTGSSELVRSHIRNLRAKLRRVSGGRELIRTTPRRGYRLG